MASPTLVVTTPTSPQTDDTILGYTLAEDTQPSCAMTFEYSPDNGMNWFLCTESADPLSEGLTIPVTPTPTAHIFVWEAATDLGLVSAGVLMRVTADDSVDPTTIVVTGMFDHYSSVLAGAPYYWSGVFASNNNAPTGAFTFPNPAASPATPVLAVQGGTILLEYILYDEEADTIDVDFEYSKDGGRTWISCDEGTGGDGKTGLASDTVANGGIAHTYAWDSTALRSAHLQVRARGTDPYETGAWFYTEEFWIENQDNGWWVPKQVPPIIYKLDPDGIIKYWADLTEAWRIREAEDILGFENLFDANECPQEYLPQLASRIALRIDQNFPEATRRRQIPFAFQWYKSKGLHESVTERFAGLGYAANVVDLWTNGIVCADHRVDFTYMPHSRVDLYTYQYDSNSPVAPTDFTELGKYFDEVRPIHVLLRGMITGVIEIELYPIPDDEDGSIDMTILPVSTPYPINPLYSGAVVNKGAGQIGFPGPGSKFQAGDVIELEGTTNYDGQYTVDAVTQTEIEVTSAYVAETFVGDETVKLVVTVPNDVQHVPHDRMDDEHWRARPGPGLSLFNGTRARVTLSAVHNRFLGGTPAEPAVQADLHTLDVAAAFPLYDGKVGLPITDNRFRSGTVVISGTVNYDGTWTLEPESTPTRVVITTTYVAEVFAGTETVQQTVGPNVGKVLLPSTSHDYVDGQLITIAGTTNYDGNYTVESGTTEDSIMVTAAYVAENFDGTPTVALQNPASPRVWIPLRGVRDPFTDEIYTLRTRPEIGPPFREVIGLGAGTGASWTLGDGSSYYSEDVGEISAYDLGNVLLPGYPITV